MAMPGSRQEETMSSLKYAALAATAIALSAPTALAGEARGPAGTWQPDAVETHFGDRTVLILGDNGRFAALVARKPEASVGEAVDADGLDAASGTWILAEDGGEVVLTFDNSSARPAPGTTRFLQMLLLGDELRPYPAMEGRSPIAANSWRRIDDALASTSGERAAR
jgi:hypothetical protein